MKIPMDRVKELGKIIEGASIERREILDSLRREKNLLSIGKCFKRYVDDGNNHYDYHKISSVDDRGDIKAFRIRVWKRGASGAYQDQIEFTVGEHFVEDWVVDPDEEISLEEYNKLFNDCLEEVKNGNSID